MMTPAHKPKSDAARNFPVMAGKLGLSTVPAAWPTGMTQFLQTYEVCRRCPAGEACNDWLESAPNSIKMPPEFCPNAAGFVRAKKQERCG